MKVILTGATGLIGNTLLTHLLSHPSITSIIVLSRRALPLNLSLPHHSSSSKPDFEANRSDVRLKTLILESESEWLRISDGVKRECEGAVGCLWALGGPVGAFENEVVARRVLVEFPIEAIRAFGGAGRDFGFCYISGHGVERDEGRAERLLVFRETRRMKGVMENKLLELARERESLEICIARPGGVLPVEGRATKMLGSVMEGLGIAPSVGVDELAATCVDWVVDRWKIEGVDGEGVVGNAELKRRGREILKRKKMVQVK